MFLVQEKKIRTRKHTNNPQIDLNIYKNLVLVGMSTKCVGSGETIP